MLFENRQQAGEQLAEKLLAYRDKPNTLVLALPRGGVPIGKAIAQRLNCPLDIILVRKLGVPYQPELAMGAIASGGIEVWNEDLLKQLAISPEAIDAVKQKESAELARRQQKYRGEKPLPTIKNKTIILCDDGIATGATTRAAIAAITQQQPKKIIVAVPVSPTRAYHQLTATVDEVICLEISDTFFGIGQFYRYFPQLSDEEVIRLLSF